MDSGILTQKVKWWISVSRTSSTSFTNRQNMKSLVPFTFICIILWLLEEKEHLTFSSTEKLVEQLN